MPLDRLARRFKQGLEKTILESEIPAETGFDNEDGSFTLKVDNQTNMVWVRLYGNKAQTYPAYNTQVGLKTQLPVIVKRNRYDEYEIVRIDAAPATEAYAEAATHFAVPQRYGELEDVVYDSMNLKPGRVRIYEENSLTVWIEPFHYVNGSLPAYWPGGTLDLTGNVPSVSGFQRWVKVGIDPATNTPVAANGTLYPGMLSLLPEQTTGISWPGTIPVGAVALLQGQTEITDSRKIIDVRPWIWDGGSGSSAGGTGTLQFSVAGDSGTPQTILDGETLTLVGGTGIDTVAGATRQVSVAIDNTVVTLNGTQTLTNKTLTVPTIADFSNANHNHQNTAGGGQLNASSVFNTGTLPVVRGGTGQSNTPADNEILIGSGGVFVLGTLPAGSGSSPWQTDSGVVNLVTDSDTVTIGSSTGGGKLFVDGDADEIQLQIQGNSTQNALLAVLENSAGADQVTIANTGAAVFNEQGNDADFRVEGDTDEYLIVADASTDRVGIGTNAPGAKLDVRGGAIFNEAGDAFDFRVESDNVPNMFRVLGTQDMVVIGDNPVDVSAIFQINSTTKGVLIPTMTPAQRDAIVSGQGGLLVFNNTDYEFNYRDENFGDYPWRSLHTPGSIGYDQRHWVQVMSSGDDIAALGASVAHLGGTRTTNHDADGSWLNYNATTSSITAGFDSDSFDIFQIRHNPYFFWRVKFGALTDARYFFGFTSAAFTGNSDTLPGHGLAFRLSTGTDGTTLKAIARDGTTQSVTTVGGTFANSELLLSIRVDGSSAFFGRDGNETEVTSNLPSSTQGLGFMALVRPTSGSEVWDFSKMSGFWGS